MVINDRIFSRTMTNEQWWVKGGKELSIGWWILQRLSNEIGHLERYRKISKISIERHRGVVERTE